MDNYQDYAESLYELPVDPVISHARICCFSKRGDNMLMWSHYADGLRGFSLGFSAKALASIEPRELYLFDVLYEDSPPFIDTAVLAVHQDQVEYHIDAIYETKDSGWISEYEGALKVASTAIDAIYQRMLATKHTAWKYEEEVRLIKSASNPGSAGESLEFPAGALQVVILGERMPEDQKEAIRSIVASKYPNAQLKIAKLAPLGSFDIEVTADEVATTR